ncbi:hypothetical protein [uncultured Aliiroseovarius sp.]|uniref:hypothetical protein n=1 Tax=uncultured Aliiroseovarius sp. TaxID=1658783 RepID=UPI0026295CF6|nr:hypothetical protein [uncultured Aliiroseovarius sp.]
MDSLVGFLLAIAVLVFVIWLYLILPASMATERNRSALIWVLISLVGSPLLAILLLIALGDAPKS